MQPEVEFPVYRKYSNGASIFKIESQSEFTERKKLGSKWIELPFVADIYPDQMMIADMIDCTDNSWVVASEADYKNAQATNQV